MNSSGDIVRCYGITKDPETNNFMMVMRYIENGSLRQHLNKSFNSLNWEKKLYNLYWIATGINHIHSNNDVINNYLLWVYFIYIYIYQFYLMS